MQVTVLTEFSCNGIIKLKKDGGDYEREENTLVFWHRGKKDIAT